MKEIACSDAVVHVADRSSGLGVAAALLLFAGLGLGNAAKPGNQKENTRNQTHEPLPRNVSLSG